ncbi:MAG: hypothetical protein IJN92_10125 [Lachnospiraceae bacterium]|nr:hypothetical protein [Lachnospiraceae bacterium]
MKEKNMTIYMPEINGTPVILNTDLFPFYEFVTKRSEQVPCYNREESVLPDITEVKTRLLKENNCERYLEELNRLEVVLIEDIEQFLDKWNIIVLRERV